MRQGKSNTIPSASMWHFQLLVDLIWHSDGWKCCRCACQLCDHLSSGPPEKEYHQWQCILIQHKDSYRVYRRIEIHVWVCCNMGICPCNQNSDIYMEVPKKQQPSPTLDILYCQVHACKWGTGCAPGACNQNTMCDHLNTEIRKNTNKLKQAFKSHASIFFLVI